MWKQYLAGAVISLAAIYLFVSTVHPAEMWRSLAGMNPWYFIPATILYWLSYVFRAARWKYLLRPLGRVSLLSAFKALMIGFLGNNLLPAHLGEIVRAYVIGDKEKVSKSAALATIVMERIYDGLTVLLMLLAVFLFVDLPEGRVPGTPVTTTWLRNAGWVGLGIFGGLLAVLQAFRWQKTRALKVLKWLLRPVPERFSVKLVEVVDVFADGLALARPRDLLFVAMHSFLTWGFLAAWAWTIFPAFGLNFGFMAGVMMEAGLAVALMIPAAPGFIGTWHVAATAVVILLGGGAEKGGSYAMALWVHHFFFSTIVGLWALKSMGLDFSAFRGRRKNGKKAAEKA